MNLLTREFVNARCHFSRRQSYRMIPASASGLVSSAELLELLNQVRRGIAETILDVPHDLATPDEAAHMMAELGVTTRRLANWAKRRRNPCPHFRFNSHTIRYPLARLVTWLEDMSRRRRH